MSLTWIVILSLFGFIVLILIFRAIYFFIFSKKKIASKKLNVEAESTEIDYFEPMIRLFNLILFWMKKLN